MKTEKPNKNELLREIILLKQKTNSLTKENNDEHFYKTIFDKASTGIAIYDITGKCLDANEALIKNVGGTKKGIYETNIFEAESWKKSGLTELAAKAIETDEPKCMEIETISSFNKYVHLKVNIIPAVFNKKNT